MFVFGGGGLVFFFLGAGLAYGVGGERERECARRSGEASAMKKG